MYSFKYDYSEGCHPRILEALAATNTIQQPGYGQDDYSLAAAEMLRKLCGRKEAAVHFMSGGTQANLVIIQAFLKTFEAVICTDTAHININEAAAVESTGHKMIAVKNDHGKITVAAIRQVVETHTNFPHVARPKMVYISQATELGTLYTKKELQAISAYCRKNELYLFLDGARLATALACEGNTPTLKDIAGLTDVFYLGGTKNGALLGEAVVISHPFLQKDFDFHVKQRGALLAKGRLLGIQFYTLLQNDLYLELARHAYRCASAIAKAAKEKGFRFYTTPQTNQLFMILPKNKISALQKNYDFYICKPISNTEAVVRVVTSWATEPSMVDAFIKELKK